MTIEIEVDAAKADPADPMSDDYVHILSIKEGERNLLINAQDTGIMEAILLAALNKPNNDDF